MLRTVRQFHTGAGLRAAYILSGARTPLGEFQGALKTVQGTDLGATAAREAISRAKLDPKAIDEVLFGMVLQANAGQAPARQVAIKAGVPVETDATTINKVCASGLKSVTLAAQSILLGDHSIMLAGGAESMSNAPYYLPRASMVYGDVKAKDAILNDGLLDAYEGYHMGIACENTNKRENITRKEQDEFAIESYRRASESIKTGRFKAEIVPVTIKTKKGETVVSEDEGPGGLKLEKVPTLRPAFDKNGSVTAANSPGINDGAAALVLASGDRAKELGSPVLGKIIAYADAATAPIDFTIAPSLAIPTLLKKAGLEVKDIAKWEINEAFAAVAIANTRRLGLDPELVNVNGGAVALGHPIGASGARILVTLLHLLKEGEFGVAAICNGGGAATSILVQKVSSV